MHGGMKVYRGAAAAARHYVESDRSRADDYYLAEGSGLAIRIVATPDGIEHRDDINGETYERWVAGDVVETGAAKGRLRTDDQAVRFVEVTVNGPKTWSLAAAFHPDVAAAMTPRRRRRLRRSSVGWLPIRRRGLDRVVVRYRCQSTRSRQPSCITSPPAQATPTDTCTSRSTRGSGQRKVGGASTPLGCATAWRRSTALDTPR